MMTDIMVMKKYMCVYGKDIHGPVVIMVQCFFVDTTKNGPGNSEYDQCLWVVLVDTHVEI